MLKAIIVDDEKKIIDLIRVLGKWESYDIEIIGYYDDGEDAY